MTRVRRGWKVLDHALEPFNFPNSKVLKKFQGLLGASKIYGGDCLKLFINYKMPPTARSSALSMVMW